MGRRERAVPEEYKLYICAYEALVDALRRRDADAARGARALMVALHKELMKGKPPPAPKQHQNRTALWDDATDILAFLEGDTEFS